MKSKYIVIGAGAAGLVIAIGLAKLKKSVLLVEDGHFGGDCTNFGCVPSKALITLANQIHNARSIDKFGIETSFQCDGRLANNYVKRIVNEFIKHENLHELEKQGIHVINGKASFLSKHIIKIVTQNNVIKAYGKKIFICSGSKPLIPQIEGIEKVNYLTNETIFQEVPLPKSLSIVGAGPIGCELAQSLNRLGVKITLIHRSSTLLKREEEKASKFLEENLNKEGVRIFLNSYPINVAQRNEEIFLTMNQPNGVEIIKSEKVLFASGRVPSLSSLDLEKANIIYDQNGIKTDQYNRTNQKHIFAVGDCIGQPFFTHYAEHQARAVLLSNVIPFFKQKGKPHNIPRVTYTYPEIASIGMNEKEALKKYRPSGLGIYEIDSSQIDRSVITGEPCFIKIITKRYSSKIIGATIVGERAGEMLMEIALCMQKNIPLRSLSELIHPYPTYSRGIRKAADTWILKILGR